MPQRAEEGQGEGMDAQRTGAAETATAGRLAVWTNRVARAIDLPALVAVAIWGAAFPVIKIGYEGFPPLAYAALRPVLSVLALLLVLGWQHQPVLVERRDWPRLLLAGYAGMAVFQAAFLYGLARTSAGHSALLLCASPLLGAPLLAVAGVVPLTRRAVLGLLCGFLGVGLVVLDRSSGAGVTLLGDALTLLAALGWVGVTVLPQPLVARYGAVRITMWMLAASATVLLPPAWRELIQVVRHPPGLLPWLSLLYSSVIAMALANALWQQAARRLGTVATLAYFYLQPVGAILLAWPLLGERPSWLQLLGGGIVCLGVALAQSPRQGADASA
jgi:drug/metabolite transporter (DMT)-like permease